MEDLKEVLEIIEPLSLHFSIQYLAACEVPQLNYIAFNHASELTLERYKANAASSLFIEL